MRASASRQLNQFSTEDADAGEGVKIRALPINIAKHVKSHVRTTVIM